MSWQKARKKPVVIEFREPIPSFTMKMGNFKSGFKAVQVEKVRTLEGEEIAIPGKHYIIRGVKGELYPIEKEIFNQTYDIIEGAKK